TDGGFSAERYQEVLVRDVRPSLIIISGAVGLVLLIACANVASLLLVRANARKREMAIRAAIGAGQRRIIRQLLTESVLLSMISGVLGLVAGTVALRALLVLNPAPIPRMGANASAVGIDWRVLAFAFVAALFTGLTFGVFPALQVSRNDLTTTLKESGGRSGSGFRQNRARAVFVITETALALI